MKNADEIAELLKAHDEMIGIAQTLAEDETLFTPPSSEPNIQPWRRAYIRALFAYIEGITYRMKAQAFSAYTAGGAQYTREELAIILEESYSLNDKGEVVTRSIFNSTHKNVRFAFNMYARAWGVIFILDCSDHKWASFKKAIGIRNRVTHPKTLADLNVSDEDMQILREGAYWYSRNSLELLLDIRDKLIKDSESLKQMKDT